jgi:N utilization substance protein A
MTSDQAEVFAFFSQEVPEVAEGTVEIKAIARKPGVRSKVALYSHDPGVDCVGVRGCRTRSPSGHSDQSPPWWSLKRTRSPPAHAVKAITKIT